MYVLKAIYTRSIFRWSTSGLNTEFFMHTDISNHGQRISQSYYFRCGGGEIDSCLSLILRKNFSEFISFSELACHSIQIFKSYIIEWMLRC